MMWHGRRPSRIIPAFSSTRADAAFSTSQTAETRATGVSWNNRSLHPKVSDEPHSTAGAFPVLQAALEELARLLHVLVRMPRQESSDGGVARPSGQDRFCVLQQRRTHRSSRREPLPRQHAQGIERYNLRRAPVTA